MLTKRLINLTVYFILCAPLQGLAPMLQVKLAHIWFETCDKYSARERQEFVLGSLINELPHLEKSHHTSTYLEGVTLKDVFHAKTSFEAGRLYNHYLRALRKRHAERNSIYDLLHGIESEKKDFFLKLLEDELMYDRQLCIKACSYLSAISEGEILTGVKVDRLAIWHGVLYKYLGQKPSESIPLFKKDQRIKLDFTKEETEFWRAALLFFSSHKKIKEYVEDFMADVEISLEVFKLRYLSVNRL